jgi:alpha-1,3-mannosyltransferase
MRIVHVVRQFHPAVGGMEEVVRELAATQARAGHAVRVVTLNRIFNEQGTLAAREQLDDIEIVRVPFVGSTRYPIAWRVIRHIRDADVVHVHGIDFLFDYLAWTAPLHRRKLVVSTHGAFFHTPYAAALKQIYFRTVTRFSLSGYAGVAAVSAADEALFQTVRRRGIALIENGVNIVKFDSASATSPRKAMIALGRFSSNKRLDRVIAFFAAVHRADPEWRLIVAGRASDLSPEDLRRVAAEAGVADCVTVVSSPTTEDIRAHISGCSVFVSASDYEGFGLAAVEGMSAGLLPVLSPIAPFRRLIETTGVGLSVDFADCEEAAAQFLPRWQEFSKDYAAQRRAAINASAAYGWPGVGAQYETLYESVRGTKVRAILDVPVDVTTFSEATTLLDKRARLEKPDMVIFANAHTLNHASEDARTREALKKSIVLNDGVGVDIASRLLFGKGFPENLNGTDFVPAYLTRTRNKYRIFLLGGRPGIAERAAAHIAKIAPHHTIAGTCHGYLSPPETAGAIHRIRESRADILLIGLGDPKQELWLTEHLAETGCRLGVGVGALFDFMAEAVPRAPAWVRNARLEWAYRILQEPGRLWRRYFVGMPIFLFRVGRQWLTGARVSNAVEQS